MQSATGHRSPPPHLHRRSCRSLVARIGSAPEGTAPRSVSARADVRQHDPAAVRPDAPPRYSLPARSAAPVEQSSDRPAVTGAKPRASYVKSGLVAIPATVTVAALRHSVG